MTDPEMNARQAKKIGGPSAVLAAVAALGGCAGTLDPSTDAASPIAPRVQALVDANRTYPRWADFPRSGEPLPEPVEVAARVGTLHASGDTLAAEAARIDWTLGDPAAFAAEVNSRIDAQVIAPVTVQTQAEIEAYAESIRRRGAAPPPVDRSQPPR
jgi:hypothetical protein